MPFDPAAIPLWGWLAIFAASAAVVWAAGGRITGLVDALAERTGMQQAFAGMLLLGGITSLPEVAAVSTSAATGNAAIAVNNLLGTASINILLLAVADLIYGRDALTGRAAQPAVLMQGVLSMLLASAVALIAAAGDVAMFGLGFGAGTGFIALASVGAIWISSHYEHRHAWEVVDNDYQDKGEGDPPQDEGSLRRILLGIGLCAVLILGAGSALAISADAIAQETGISVGLVGFLLVGFATSLPEVSSITAAVRRRRYQLAIGDVFGTNIFNIMLIFLADLVYAGEPVLSGTQRFEIVGAGLAVLLTGIFVVGLLERRDRAVLRMGYDTVAALATFGIGVALLAKVSG